MEFATLDPRICVEYFFSKRCIHAYEWLRLLTDFLQMWLKHSFLHKLEQTLWRKYSSIIYSMFPTTAARSQNSLTDLESAPAGVLTLASDMVSNIYQRE